MPSSVGKEDRKGATGIPSDGFFHRLRVNLNEGKEGEGLAESTTRRTVNEGAHLESSSVKIDELSA